MFPGAAPKPAGTDPLLWIADEDDSMIYKLVSLFNEERKKDETEETKGKNLSAGAVNQFSSFTISLPFMEIFSVR